LPDCEKPIGSETQSIKPEVKTDPIKREAKALLTRIRQLQVLVSAGAICPEHAKRLFQIETEMKSGKEVRSQNKDRIYWIDRILS
jgi:hypothetical protein